MQLTASATIYEPRLGFNLGGLEGETLLFSVNLHADLREAYGGLSYRSARDVIGSGHDANRAVFDDVEIAKRDRAAVSLRAGIGEPFVAAKDPTLKVCVNVARREHRPQARHIAFGPCLAKGPDAFRQ